MFRRVEIKENAKFVLTRSYWMSLLVTFLAVLIADGSGLIGRGNYIGPDVNLNVDIPTAADLLSLPYDQSSIESTVTSIMQYVSENGAMIALFGGLTLLVSLVISLVWNIFVKTPVQLGRARYFIATREQQNEVNFSYTLYGFKFNYIKQAWAYFSTKLILILWLLLPSVPSLLGTLLAYFTKIIAFNALGLFSIPLSVLAIMKYFQYIMVPYLLANNCNLDGKRCRELSTKMTDGNKWNLFVLTLSFIGWFILGAACCGIGIFFVMPYYHAAKAEAYTCLKAELIQNKGISSDEELPSLLGAAC